MRIVVIIFFTVSGLFVFKSSGQDKNILDSVNKYYWYVKDTDRSFEDRLKQALIAKKFSDQLGIDSVKLRVQRQLSLMYYFNDMYEEYVPQNHNNLKIAKRLKDSSALIVANTNLGSYYLSTERNDSSYYYFSNALKSYKSSEISERKALNLFYLSNIQQEEKAYVGAEQDAIAAIQILNKIPKTEDRLQLYWNLYNLLAIISERNLLEDKAFEYYDTSIAYSDEMKDGFGYKISSINNKGNAYLKFGNYSKALESFNELLNLKDEYNEDEPDLYPIVLINIARTKFKSNNYQFKDIEAYFLEAIKIVEKLELDNIKSAASLGLSKLYAKHNKYELAKRYGNQALNISNKILNNEYKMEALLVLSELYEGEKGKDFLRTHIKISDSLQTNERLVQNKFARVKFDTDQLEAENEQISQENLYLIILSIGLIFSGLLVYIFISQRAKNKELRLVQEQQKANEEIYNLMLGQHDKVEEARSEEKIRVSKELHDGVLGELFGVRLSLDSLNFSEGIEAIKSRAGYINKLKTIEKEIREISHKMNTDFVSGSGFMDIVTELIENQTKAYGLTYQFNFTDDVSWESIPNKTKINIYRILQESLQNIYKHAEANHVKIDIIAENDKINIYIIDNGKGFEISKSKKGIGLKNMTSRVDEINGEIDWNSELKNGTTVHVKIPYLI